MKKSIMIDMDDVICECGFLHLLEEFVGEKIDLSQHHNFYLQNILNKEDKKAFFANWDKINLYEDATPYEGCVDAIKKLSEKYDIFICTDFIWKDAPWAAGSNAKNKYDFLHYYFPFIDPRHFIFGGVKSIIQTDIKIDDRPVNLKNAQTKLLFNAWHNGSISDAELEKEGMIRVMNWEDILKILL